MKNKTKQKREHKEKSKMKNTTTPGEEHNSPLNVPSVDVSITTSSPELNLEANEDLKIYVELTLHHTGPITFAWWGSSLFNGKLIYDDGLAFIDVESGKRAERDEEFMFPVFGDGELWAYRTLHPEKPYIIEEEIGPDEVKVYGPPTKDAVDHPVKIKEWLGGLDGLKNGKQYDIKLGNCGRLSHYFEGTTEEAVESFNNTKSIDFKDKTIVLNQVNTPRISVSRSDGGGYEFDRREFAAEYREFQQELKRYKK